MTGLIVFLIAVLVLMFVGVYYVDSKKMWVMLAAFGIPLGIMILFGAGLVEDGAIGFVLVGLALLAAGLIGLYFWRNGKEVMGKDNYEKIKFFRITMALCQKKEKYLKEFENDNEYYVLKEFFEKLTVFNGKYASEIMAMPMIMTRPVSPYTAGMLVSQVGGVVAGAIAAQNAMERQRAYEENVKSVIENELKTKDALEKLTYCYQSIENILKKNTSVSNDWENTKIRVDEEIKEKYKISSFHI